MSNRHAWIAVVAMTWLLSGAAWTAAAELAGDPTAIRVAIYEHSPRPDAKGPTNLERLLTPAAGFETRRVSAEQIREGSLGKADVVVFPGGSGSAQAKRLGPEGRDVVCRFVSDGGGYVGICAGSYLASSQYDWSLRLMRSRVIDRKHWARGSGIVQLSLSDEGRALLGVNDATAEVMYAQGPLLAPAIEPGLAPYTPLALYESEIAEKGAPEGVMVGTTAIAAGAYGRGRVLCFSPHPEKAEGPHRFIESGVRWAAVGLDSER
ncbi:hypothetical protein Pla108_41020 [Botrimarina colliarenosi]|uniref:Biotin-protein ligase N-terminal domain-containing protein n=1 Tax=Botrimarina colliarenosi TaxID=2528001 RepID=A0A5C5ZZ97_9BACT|nr:BPL-N domain-containing protein [Botrimarina colliarenosi]TWT92476.1 hypothetical protein Pla108_41020 [Botrimarina colliarenosi]